MKTKDTVMSPYKLNKILDDVIEKVGYADDDLIELKIAKAQAEISFKAGMKEVVGWINSNMWWLAGDSLTEKWQAKLKEWGL